MQPQQRPRPASRETQTGMPFRGTQLEQGQRLHAPAQQPRVQSCSRKGTWPWGRQCTPAKAVPRASSPQQQGQQVLQSNGDPGAHQCALQEPFHRITLCSPHDTGSPARLNMTKYRELTGSWQSVLPGVLLQQPWRQGLFLADALEPTGADISSGISSTSGSRPSGAGKGGSLADLVLCGQIDPTWEGSWH